MSLAARAMQDALSSYMQEGGSFWGCVEGWPLRGL